MRFLQHDGCVMVWLSVCLVWMVCAQFVVLVCSSPLEREGTT